ncbi:MAG: DNA-binding protein [Bacteroidetes bacterium]|nr:DNA-binding protein [Bacteroidota bacterium]
MAKTNTALSLRDETAINQIYFIRGHKVMLDRDLAKLYGVETKHLKRQVKRNPDRFPEDFMFELTTEEFKNWRYQIGTSNISDVKGLRYAPYAFTEQGVAILSSVLNSKKAISVNIQVIRVFTRIRQILLDNSQLRFTIEEIRKSTENNSKNIKIIFQHLDELVEKQKIQKARKPIGYKIPKKRKNNFYFTGR